MRELRPCPKPEKPVRGTAEARAYMADVARLPCCACGVEGPSICHHPIHGRHAQRKASDLDVIPLCARCHDHLHRSPDFWREWNGFDTDFVIPTRKAVERARKSLIGGR